MNFDIALTLAPRKSVTIFDTLQALRQAGFEQEINIFAEPDMDSLIEKLVNSEFKDLHIHISFEKLGCFKNFNRLLKTMQILRHEKNLLIFQDDFLIHPKAKRVLDRADNFERLGYYCLYTAYGMRNLLRLQKGWSPATAGWHCFGGAYLSPYSVIDQVVEHKFYKNHLVNYESNKQSDACYSEVMKLLNLHRLYHNPSLCKHIGYTSTFGTGFAPEKEPEMLKPLNYDLWNTEQI